MKSVASSILGAFSNMSSGTKRLVATFGLMAGAGPIFGGVSAGVLGLIRTTGGLGAGIGIFRNLGLVMGRLPSGTSGFPTIVKRAIQVGAAIKLFSYSTTILSGLASKIPLLAGLAPHLRNIGDSANRAGSPLLRFMKIALTIGSIISGVGVAMKLAKAIGAISAAAAAAGGAVFLITGLAQAVSQLAGVAGLLPAAILGGVVAIATLKLGVKGVGDAFKAFATGDMAKFDEALKKLAPSAQSFVKEITKLSPAFKAMQLDIQQKLFAGLSNYIKPLAATYLPMLRTTLAGTATDFNATAISIAKFFSSGTGTSEVLSSALGNTRTWLRNLQAAVVPLISVFLDLAQVGSKVLVDMTGNVGSLATKFAQFVNNAKETGALETWMRNGVQAVKDLGAILANVGVALKAVFTGLNGGDGAGFLAMLRNATQAVRDFLTSTTAQEGLRQLGEMFRSTLSRYIDIFLAAWTQLEPAIVTLIPVIQQISSAMATGLIAAFTVMGPVVQAVANIFAFLSPVLAPILGVLLGVGVSAKIAMLAFSALGSVLPLLVVGFKAVMIAFNILKFAFVTNPWIGIIVAVIALVVLIVTNWDTIKAYLLAAWDWIKSTAETVWNAIVGFFTGIWTSVSGFFISVWTSIKDFLVGVWTAISTVATTVWNAIVTFLSQVWQGFVQAATTAWNNIVAFLTGVWEVIWNIFRYSAAILLAIFFTIWTPMWEMVQFIWGEITDFLNMAWQGIVLAANTIFPPVIAFFTMIWTAVSDFFIMIWTAITGFLTGVWNGIVSTATSVWTAISSAVQTVNQAISDFIMPIWQAIVDFLTGLWESISSTASAVWSAISSAVTTVNDAIWSAISSVWNTIVGFISGIWNTITGIFSGATSSVMSTLASLWNTISGLASTAMNLLVDAGRNIVTGLWNGIAAMGTWLWNQIMGWIKSVVPGPILSFLGIASPSKWMRDEVGKQIPAGIMGGITDMKSKMIKTAVQMTSTLANASKLTKDQLAQPALAAMATSLGMGATSKAGFAVTPSGSLTTSTGGVDNSSASSTAGVSNVSTEPSRQTTIQSLILQVAGNFDPTNPTQWREAVKSLKEEIRKIERGAQGATV